MARFCTDCGVKLSFFSLNRVCNQCKRARLQEFIKKEALVKEESAKNQAILQGKLNSIKDEVLATNEIKNQQISFLQYLDGIQKLNFYSDIYNSFISHGDLSEKDINVLKGIKEGLGLSDDETHYNEQVLPYLYVDSIKNKNELPTINLTIVGINASVILKKDEVIHFACPIILKEIRTVNLGYEGISQGVSFRIMKGVHYRVGANRGHLVKEDRLVETSKGVCLVTDKRIFLHPAGVNKPLSIPLCKILSYSCFSDGVQLYKDGREKGFFLNTFNSSSAEILGLCLSHLLGAQDVSTGKSI